jgi:hypothetical protein
MKKNVLFEKKKTTTTSAATTTRFDSCNPFKDLNPFLFVLNFCLLNLRVKK